jgi:hypothetical protein
MAYASRTGTGRNLAGLRGRGWGLLVSRAGVWRTENFTDIVGDNGAWADFQAGRKFDDDAFDRFLDWIAPHSPRWIVLPDIVAGGLHSLDLSVRWSNRCLSVSEMVLLAVQDGMTEPDVAHLVGPKVGVFLGGSTPWKLATMGSWGAFCQECGAHYHVARVNTRRRMMQAAFAGADSVDGSSATRYAVTLPKLDHWRRQPDLLAPEKHGTP